MDAQGVGLAQESQLPRPSQQRNEDTTGSTSDSNEEARPQYWCHSCQLQVLVNIAEQTGEVECLACGNSFVEEVEEDGEDSLGMDKAASPAERAGSGVADFDGPAEFGCLQTRSRESQ